jgi:hypothetical protein
MNPRSPRTAHPFYRAMPGSRAPDEAPTSPRPGLAAALRAIPGGTKLAKPDA